MYKALLCFFNLFHLCPLQAACGHTSFTSLHSTSLDFTSLHFISLHFISLHFTSLHFTSLRFPSHRFASLRFASHQFSHALIPDTLDFVLLIRPGNRIIGRKWASSFSTSAALVRRGRAPDKRLVSQWHQ